MLTCLKHTVEPAEVTNGQALIKIIKKMHKKYNMFMNKHISIAGLYGYKQIVW